MKRRDRIEARIKKREAWAESAKKESESRFHAAKAIADLIPLGQPILVGHHSEKHARQDQDKIHNNMSKSVEAGQRAKHHASVAENLEASLGSIFSDDDNAIEAIKARIAGREAERTRAVAINRAARAGKLDQLEPALTAGEEESLLSCQRFSPGHLGKPGFPAYHLSNLTGRIAADRKRLAEIERRVLASKQAEEAGGVKIARYDGGFCSVCFAEKPDRDVLDALRDAGFRWSGGAWSGETSKIPAPVIKMELGQSAPATKEPTNEEGEVAMIGTWNIKPGWSLGAGPAAPVVANDTSDEWIQVIEQGTILVYSWGVEQTNVMFLVVTAPRTSSFVMVAGFERAEPVPSEPLAMRGTVTPVLPAIPLEPPVKRKVKTGEGGREYVKMPYGIALPWDGKPVSCSWYG